MRTRSAACIVAPGIVCSAFITPTAFAGGKSANGCANGDWTLAMYVTQDGVPAGTVAGDLVNVSDSSIQQRNHDALATFAAEGIDVVAIFKSVDNNGDGLICWKLPSGWDAPQPVNKAGFLSIGDNKF